MANKQVIRDLTSNTSTALFEAGIVYNDGATGKNYRYVKAEDANITVGDVLEYSDTSGYEVTNDRAGGSSIGRVVAGVAIGSITDGSYGWIQISGRNASVKTDGGVTAGQGLVPHATADGKADSESNGSTVTVTSGQVFGHALETDDGTTTAGTCAAILNCA